MTALTDLLERATETGDFCITIDGNTGGDLDAPPASVWVIAGPPGTGNALAVEVSMSADEKMAHATVTAYRNGELVEPDIISFAQMTSLSTLLD